MQGDPESRIPELRNKLLFPDITSREKRLISELIDTYHALAESEKWRAQHLHDLITANDKISKLQLQKALKERR